jgi:hypothetical protein
MNWKLIFQLSVFGLIMAFGTVSLIPESREWIFWLVIFIFGALVIAKRCAGKYFLHGFFLSLVNCVWVTFAHVYFYSTYILHHADMKAPGALSTHPRVWVLLIGPVSGVVSGLIQGLLAFLASKVVKSDATGAVVK